MRVSDIRMRRFGLIATAACLLSGVAFYAYVTGRFDLLHRSPGRTIDVNGTAVHADLLIGRMSAVVTRRDKGKEHSYLLLYAGDVDQTGDIGEVIDCRDWIAPRMPVLIRTSTYPGCELHSQEGASRSRISLILKGAAEQFTTPDKNVISIRKR